MRKRCAAVTDDPAGATEKYRSPTLNFEGESPGF